MPEPVDAYKALQVDPEADDEVIKAAYRRLARKYHPDLAAGPEASARMTVINAAWTLIGAPSARAAYDRARSGVRGLSAGSERGSGPGTGDRVADRRPAGAEARSTQRGAPQTAGDRPPETISRDWTSGRSTQGGGFDESMRAADGLGAAGPPPGRPSGSVLTFGRFNGWSLGEIARHDIEYIEWLDRMPIGRTHREEIDNILRAAGRRQSAESDSTERRGLFRRR
jgi:curved DNA-binding protein CbpA